MDSDSSKRGNGRSRWAVIGMNLLCMAAVAVLLAWLALAWLDVWTGHGRESVVPAVENRPCRAAVEALEAQGFAAEVSDSVYDSHTLPGTVVDQNPKAGTRVKPGRLVYLTINALSPRTVTLPRLTDMSLRQARAILDGLGLKNVTAVTVPSDFKDLVLGVVCGGHTVSAGARVAVNAPIVLEVGEGSDGFADNDSIAGDPALADESTFASERYDLF